MTGLPGQASYSHATEHRVPNSKPLPLVDDSDQRM